jgi:hypothetical protein
MNTFPLLAAFTICVSFAILSASFDDLREAPLTLDRAAPLGVSAAMPATATRHAPAPSTIDEANEGLLDRELASLDPVEAWLDRHLTPATN